MIRVDKVFKAKEYAQGISGAAEAFNPLRNAPFNGVMDDVRAVKNAVTSFPYRSALTVAGLIVLMYITFKVGTKFGKIQTEIKKRLWSD